LAKVWPGSRSERGIRWLDPADDDGNITWTREFGARMKPYTTGRAYLNFIGEEGEDRVRAAFGPET
jgi:hypothetical protein